MADDPAPHAPPGPEDRHRLPALIGVAKALTAETDLDGFLDLLTTEAARLLGADRCALFLLDRERDELQSKIAMGLKEHTIRLKTTEGIAGFVATTGYRVNIPDVSEDPRFEASIDRDTGYCTRSVLAAPLLTGVGEVLGVLEALNKASGPFTRDDEELLEALASQATMALQHARLTDELGRANAEIARLDELKSNFLANMSHELRTPLSPIVGYVQLLLGGGTGPLTDRQHECLQVMAESTRRLQGLIEDLLAFLELDRGEAALNRQPMDLTQLLREQAEAATAAAQEKGIALEVALSAPLPGVMADPRAVGRAVAQLLDNAVKFTPPGGCVTLAAALEPGAWADRRPPPARGGRRAPRDAVRVSVADTGMGIPASEQARIFDRFYQVDGSTTRAFGGTGLGLALVKRIVEAHGSRVTVESVVDAGSTFAFTLPAA